MGAVGNLFLVSHGFHSPAFSTALLDELNQGRTVGLVTPHHVRTVANHYRPVQQFMNHHTHPGQAVPPLRLADLEHLILRTVLSRFTVRS